MNVRMQTNTITLLLEELDIFLYISNVDNNARQDSLIILIGYPQNLV